MKHKHFKHLFTALLLLCTTVVTAHDFEVGGIYYNILSETDKTVEVTYKGASSNEYLDEYSGSVVIPSTIVYSSVINISGWTSTNKNNGSTSQTSYRLVVEAGNVLKFDWSVSSETNYDWLIITLDGTEIVKKSGSQSGSYEKTFNTAGTHNLVVKYTKDSSQSSNNDEGKIYNIKLIEGETEYSVTRIGSNAFEYCTALTSVEIPNSVTSIGNHAFYECDHLPSVVIGNSVKSIGDCAFYLCIRLASIKIPNSVTSIGNYAFVGCSCLTSIEIPNSVRSIGTGAFKNCPGLISVTSYAATAPIISDNAFTGISSTAVLTYPAGSDYSAWSRYFASTEELSCGVNVNWSLADGVLTISGNGAMDDYSYACAPWYGYRNEITMVVIEDGVTSIGKYAFYECNGLTSVKIGNSVTSIGDYAFEYCKSLTNVVIGESVTSIGKYAFYECNAIKKLELNCAIIDSWFKDFSSINEVVLGNSVTSIGDYAFSGTYLRSVVIPNSVTNIGNYAFYNCQYLTSIEIPNSITSIGRSAFSICCNLISIEIPNNVTSIGEGTFYCCEDLTSVEIPNSVTNIGKNAFRECSSLTSIEIPNSVTTVGESAFRDCSSITSIEIPNSVTSIGDGAFYKCYGLKSVKISNSITSVGDSTFYYCTKLTSVEIPNNVTSIGNKAFYCCSKLTSITIPNSVTSIGNYAFYSCSGLKTVVNFSNLTFSKGSSNNGYIAYYATKVINAPNAVIDGDFIWCNLNGANTLACYIGEVPELTLPADYNGENYVIGNDAFNGCTGLTSIEIPNSITSIGSDAFYGCTGLTSIEIPNSVTSIGSSAFYSCKNLKTVINFSNITFSKGSSSNGYIAYYANKVFNAPNGFIDGDFVWFENEDGMTLAGYLGDATELILPTEYNDKSVIRIGDDAFYGCTGLTSIEIPNSVTSIGNYAFYGCTGLTSIEIPNSVTSIGNYAFYGCTGLTSIEIPNSVTSIGNYAFYGCSGLTSVEIPNSVTSIGDYAFYGCTGLTSIEIPNSVTSIGNYAFYGCTGLTSIEIPNSVTSIGNYAFYGCTGLTSIEIPNSVTSIGSYAFRGCTGLTSVEIPNSVTSIGSYAFRGCTGLTSVEIPNSVTSIGSDAFYSCKNLKTVINFSNITFSKGSSSNGYIAYYADKVFNAPNGFIDGDFVWFENEDGMTLAGYLGDATELTLPADYNGKSVISIGSYAFRGCTGLTSVVIPSSITSIGGSAFESCTGLTSIEIPNSVTSIGSYAFRGCTGLASVEIPNSVTNIGNYAFYGCTGLTSIEIPNSVTSIGNNAFYGCTALKTVINDSDLDIEKGSRSNGYVAYYADEVITNEFKFELIDGVYTLVKYKGKGVKQEETTTFDSWTSTNKGYDGSTSSYKYKFDATAGSKLSFDWSVSSEANFDKLYVILDGTTVLTESGKYSGNYEHTFTVAGSHTLEVEYTKDESEYDYNDEAKIYNVKLTKTFYIPADVVLPDNYEGESYVIGESAFENNEYVASVTIPEGVEMICDKAFSGCSNLENIVIPNSMSAIGGDAFAGTKWFDNQEDGMVYIGNVLYKYKGSMPANTAITINDGTLGIAGLAFANCTGLTSITSLIPADNLFVPGSDAFVGVDKTNCTLYVPYGAKETYAATEGWEDFENIVEIIPAEITITINQYGNVTFCSDLALDFSNVEGLKAYAATGYKSNSQVVTLTRVQTSEAGIGLFLKGEPGEYVVPVIESTDEHSLNMLVGTLEPTIVNSTAGAMSNYKFTIAEGDAAPMFYPFEDGTTLSAGKAYLQIPTAWLPATAQKSLNIRFDEGEITDIDEMKEQRAESKDIYYDLSGRVVENPTSGIYIIDGKKVVVK